MRSGSSNIWIFTGATALLALLFGFPFVWMLLAAFKSNLEIFTPLPLWPEQFELTAFETLLSGSLLPFGRQLLNTLCVATLQTVGAVLLASSAGFAFAKYSFPFRRSLFIVALAVVLVPQQILALPLLSWLSTLGLFDQLWAVALPGTVTGIGVLFFTLVFRTVPDTYLDLARNEGAREWRVFWIAARSVLSAFLGFALIQFILSSHQHLLPLVLVNSDEMKTASVGLAGLYGAGMQVSYSLLMAGGVFLVLPTAALYLLLQRHLRSAISQLSARP